MKKIMLSTIILGLGVSTLISGFAFAEGNTVKTRKEYNPQVETLLKELSDLNAKEDELDLKEDKLELSYKRGKISYASYVKQELELERQDDLLDLREDEIERDLKKLGYYENTNHNYSDNDHDDFDDYDDNCYDD